MLFLGILDAQMVLHFLIHEPHLLKNLKNDLLNIIVLFDYIEGFMLLFISVLPLNPLDLEDIESHFAHLDCAELRGVGVSCLSQKSIFVPRVIVLPLDYLLLVLVKFVVEVEEIN